MDPMAEQAVPCGPSPTLIAFLLMCQDKAVAHLMACPSILDAFSDFLSWTHVVVLFALGIGTKLSLIKLILQPMI